MKITLGSFQICKKICRDICKSRCTTGMNNTGGKFCHQSAGVVDTGGKFAAGVNATATGINKTGSTFATGGK